MILTCDENHIYYGDGVRIPGVTEVIRRTGIIVYPEVEAVKRAAYRGTTVAKVIELYEKNDLNENVLYSHSDYVELKIAGYFDAYKRFKDEWIAKILSNERLVGHSIWRYGGRLDLNAITLDVRNVVFDFKTGPIKQATELQTCAYLEAIYDEMGADFAKEMWHGAVKLNSDGTYDEPILSQSRRPFNIFRQALNIVNYTDGRM